MILATKNFRRRKSIMVTFLMLVELFKGRGTQIVAWRGIPKDARLISTSINSSLEVIEFIFEHESFPEVQDGVDIYPTRIDSTGIYPEMFCEECRKRWREALDNFYAADNEDLNVVSPK